MLDSLAREGPTRLADDHALTKAGLRCVHLVETAEQGLRMGDVRSSSPFGRIVDTGMACRRDGIIPPGVDLMNVHKEVILLPLGQPSRSKVTK